MTEPEGDKRDELRLRKYIDIIVEDGLSAMLFRGAIADLSPTGLRAIVEQYLPIGTRYSFTMKSHPFLELRGEVRWINPWERDQFQVGVRFVEMSDEDRKRLQTFLDMERARLASSG